MAGKSATEVVSYTSAKFNEFSANVRRAKIVRAFEGRLLALDPGEMTGWSLWDCVAGEDDVRIAHGQMASWPLKEFVPEFSQFLNRWMPTKAVYESYHIYDWKLETHSFSDVPTLRIIGSIETQLLQRTIPYTHQTAQVAKTFIKDERLKSFGYWETGLKHSRDAHRHAMYYLCFGDTAKQP